MLLYVFVFLWILVNRGLKIPVSLVRFRDVAPFFRRQACFFCSKSNPWFSPLEKRYLIVFLGRVRRGTIFQATSLFFFCSKSNPWFSPLENTYSKNKLLFQFFVPLDKIIRNNFCRHAKICNIFVFY